MLKNLVIWFGCGLVSSTRIIISTLIEAGAIPRTSLTDNFAINTYDEHNKLQHEKKIERPDFENVVNEGCRHFIFNNVRKCGTSMKERSTFASTYFVSVLRCPGIQLKLQE